MIILHFNYSESSQVELLFLCIENANLGDKNKRLKVVLIILDRYTYEYYYISKP